MGNSNGHTRSKTSLLLYLFRFVSFCTVLKDNIIIPPVKKEHRKFNLSVTPRIVSSATETTAQGREKNL